MSLGGFNETVSVAAALTGRAHDLFMIASYAYIADQWISRGGERDAHNDAWRRTMALCVPVSDPDFWNSGLALVEQQLTEAEELAAEREGAD